VDSRGKSNVRKRITRAAVLLRQRGYIVLEPSAAQPGQTITVGPLSLDSLSVTVAYGKVRASLSPFKFLLLQALMEAEGAWCSRRALRKVLWGELTPASDSLAVHMHGLREQLRALTGKDVIAASRLRGFRLAFDIFEEAESST
jgi:DNA-binding response OmpR family regulator